MCVSRMSTGKILYVIVVLFLKEKNKMFSKYIKINSHVNILFFMLLFYYRNAKIVTAAAQNTIT